MIFNYKYSINETISQLTKLIAVTNVAYVKTEKCTCVIFLVTIIEARPPRYHVANLNNLYTKLYAQRLPRS